MWSRRIPSRYDMGRSVPTQLSLPPKTSHVPRRGRYLVPSMAPAANMVGWIPSGQTGVGRMWRLRKPFTPLLNVP